MMAKAQQRRRRPGMSVPMKMKLAAVASLSYLSLGEWSCSAAPQLLVTSNQPKCIKVMSPGGAKLVIDYEAPDLIRDMGNVWININLDTASRQAFEERIRQQKMRDRFDRPNVEAGPEGWRNPDDPRAHPRRMVDHIEEVARSDYKPQSEKITTQSGTIQHQTPIGGDLNVCIRANNASPQSPMRFAVRISIEEQDKQEYEQEKIDHHMGKMEEVIMQMQDVMAGILSEADFAKDKEMAYHRHVEVMNDASIYWPVVQVAVLLLTGFTWASHMVTFFKQKHLI